MPLARRRAVDSERYAAFIERWRQRLAAPAMMPMPPRYGGSSAYELRK